MISVLHLIWIIPAAACFGFVWATVLAMGKESDKY